MLTMCFKQPELLTYGGIIISLLLRVSVQKRTEGDMSTRVWRVGYEAMDLLLDIGFRKVPLDIHIEIQVFRLR